MYRLRDFRKKLGLTQNDLAKMFNCVQGNISAMEKNCKDLEDYQLDILIDKYGKEEVMSFHFDMESKGMSNNESYSISNTTSEEQTSSDYEQSDKSSSLRLKIISAYEEVLKSKDAAFDRMQKELARRNDEINKLKALIKDAGLNIPNDD